MKNSGLKIVIAIAMFFTSSPVFAAKKKTYRGSSEAGIRQLLNETQLHKQSITVDKYLEITEKHLPQAFKAEFKKAFKQHRGKEIRPFKVKRINSKSPYRQFRFIGGDKKNPLKIDFVLEERVFARVNGKPIYYRDMALDGGKNAMSRAMGVNPLGLLDAKQIKQLDKKALKKYMTNYRQALIAVEKLQVANRKAKKAEMKLKRKRARKSADASPFMRWLENGLVSSLNDFLFCTVSEANATSFDSGNCVNAGNQSQYRNGWCVVPESLRCNGRSGIQCNPMIFGRDSSGSAFCVTANNTATASCDAQVPLTSQANLESLVTGIHGEFNNDNITKVNNALSAAIANCSQLPASERGDQQEACAVLQSRYRDLMIQTEEAVVPVVTEQEEVIPGPPSNDTERAGFDWDKWLPWIVGGVAVLGVGYLLLRNRGGDDKKHKPEPGVGKPGEKVTNPPDNGGRLPPYDPAQPTDYAWSSWVSDTATSMNSIPTAPVRYPTVRGTNQVR